MLRSQVTLNALPLPFRAPGWASTRPEESTMVISSSVNVEMVPDVVVVFTVALVRLKVLKWDSGSTPLEPLGASAIH